MRAQKHESARAECKSMRVPYQPWPPKNVIPNPVRFLNGVRNPLFPGLPREQEILTPLETTGFGMTDVSGGHGFSRAGSAGPNRL